MTTHTYVWRDKVSRDDEQDLTRYCAREITTYLKGWPSHARSCDDEELHEEQDFCRLYNLVQQRINSNRLSEHKNKEWQLPTSEDLRLRQITYIQNID
ncbi:unnamed protein product [Thelazia callipaeda]|uniref:DUF3800 domain-containing protein n=1 Tax=Thelazia callipaeda TaxID=103827 RepID=A0A0N5CTL2_THECL|nr:unnamed protein product [Thelazia callipaeda]